MTSKKSKSYSYDHVSYETNVRHTHVTYSDGTWSGVERTWSQSGTVTNVPGLQDTRSNSSTRRTISSNPRIQDTRSSQRNTRNNY